MQYVMTTPLSIRQMVLPEFDVKKTSNEINPEEFLKSLMTIYMVIIPIPSIKISKRMRTMLGSFNSDSNTITVSKNLLNLGSKMEIEQVLKHELAHAIVHHNSPKAQPHGVEFKNTCKLIGVDSKRIINIDFLSWNKRKRYITNCPMCGSHLSKKRRSSKIRCDCGHLFKPYDWLPNTLT